LGDRLGIGKQGAASGLFTAFIGIPPDAKAGMTTPVSMTTLLLRAGFAPDFFDRLGDILNGQAAARSHQ